MPAREDMLDAPAREKWQKVRCCRIRLFQDQFRIQIGYVHDEFGRPARIAGSGYDST